MLPKKSIYFKENAWASEPASHYSSQEVQEMPEHVHITWFLSLFSRFLPDMVSSPSDVFNFLMMLLSPSGISLSPSSSSSHTGRFSPPRSNTNKALSMGRVWVNYVPFKGEEFACFKHYAFIKLRVVNSSADSNKILAVWEYSLLNLEYTVAFIIFNLRINVQPYSREIKFLCHFEWNVCILSKKITVF